MPAFMTETLARALYSRRQPYTRNIGDPYNPPPSITYSRAYYGDRLDAAFTNRASGMSNLGAASNASMLVVGSGFGFLIEALVAQGISDVYGIEPGSWYWDAANDSEWGAGIKARTAEDWIGSGTEQTSLDALPGVPNNEKFNWVIDEDAAPAHSDAELPVFIAGLEARLQGNAKGRIVHLVTPVAPQGSGDSSQNWKTMTEWEQVAPDHTWINQRGI
jgi:hypothetical protein